MKAISLHQPFASLVASGEKTIETRVWQTTHRGPLLIVSTLKPPLLEEHGQLPRGVALCVVDVVRCRPMTQADERAACCPIRPRAMAWELANVRRVREFPVRGQQCLYEVPDGQILVLSDSGNPLQSKDIAGAPVNRGTREQFGMIDVPSTNSPAPAKRSAVEREQGSLF